MSSALRLLMLIVDICRMCRKEPMCSLGGAPMCSEGEVMFSAIVAHERSREEPRWNW